MLDELRKDSAQSFTSNNQGNDDELMDQVFGDENSDIQYDEFGDPEAGFGE
jgi:hypothetical protein